LPRADALPIKGWSDFIMVLFSCSDISIPYGLFN
jgi:hypothetical protein